MKVGIIGLGLIGGSIAKAIREKHPDAVIVVYNRSADPLKKALKDGIADQVTMECDEEFKDCDFIFLCTPVQTNITFLDKLAPFLSEKTILTDVGSTKVNIHEAVDKIVPDACFIGGHPMAGKEKSSYDNSSAKLLSGAYYFLTPSDNASDEDTDRLKELIRSMGCTPKIVEPENHDFIVGAISHIPHLAAYTLVKLVKDEDSSEEIMRETCAGGFKDITRVASSDPTMWEEICMANKDNLISLLDKYIDDLEEVRDALVKGDNEGLHNFFADIKEYRKSIVG